MKIYAIRDRLINYFMQPFVGPDDKSVLASVARLVNTGEVTSDIAQAPHQFEVWTLGHVTEEGHLVPEREYLGDCSSLVRNVRGRTEPGAETVGHPEISRHRAPESLGEPNGPPTGTPIQGGTPSSRKQAEEAYKAASRGN
ncbi:MAG: nonstructural protein [Arizlama microvirus]|nr:MAG: nonstructural protein [Arizlama microvirus]